MALGPEACPISSRRISDDPKSSSRTSPHRPGKDRAFQDACQDLLLRSCAFRSPMPPLRRTTRGDRPITGSMPGVRRANRPDDRVSAKRLLRRIARQKTNPLCVRHMQPVCSIAIPVRRSDSRRWLLRRHDEGIARTQTAAPTRVGCHLGRVAFGCVDDYERCRGESWPCGCLG